MKLRSAAEIRRDAALRAAQPLDRLQDELKATTQRMRSAQVIARALIAARSSDMGITGADSFATTLRARIAGTKSAINGLHERMNATLKHGDELVAKSTQICEMVEAEHAQLEEELRQLSNFPPASDGDQKQGG